MPPTRGVGVGGEVRTWSPPPSIPSGSVKTSVSGPGRGRGGGGVEELDPRILQTLELGREGKPRRLRYPLPPSPQLPPPTPQTRKPNPAHANWRREEWELPAPEAHIWRMTTGPPLPTSGEHPAANQWGHVASLFLAWSQPLQGGLRCVYRGGGSPGVSAKPL